MSQSTPGKPFGTLVSRSFIDSSGRDENENQVPTFGGSSPENKSLGLPPHRLGHGMKLSAHHRSLSQPHVGQDFLQDQIVFPFAFFVE